jgi:two-component system CheB/CheR fusion protein
MSPDSTPSGGSASSLDALLDYLKRQHLFDFTGYKRPSLTRRIQKHMDGLKIHDFEQYRSYLGDHPDDVATLLNTILINVTSFFRDPEVWTFLAEEVLPDIVRTGRRRGIIRAWSAGCASGEEAYTLAMLLAEQLGMEEFRRRVRIYATDVDDEALRQARHAVYAEAAVRPVPPPLREKYFERLDSSYVVRPDLRRGVIFGRNNLVQDAPISRLDLLLCRNTLMFLDADAQRKVLAKFHYALDERGVLVLGTSEMVLANSTLFARTSSRQRVFRKVDQVTTGIRPAEFARATLDAGGDGAKLLALREGALNASMVAQVVIDDAGRLVIVNQLARDLFDIDRREIGRFISELDVYYRPLDLQEHVLQAKERRTVQVHTAEWTRRGQHLFLEVRVTPLHDPEGRDLGVAISFIDLTLQHQLQSDFERSSQDLETAYEELQSTNEELETTNEELQSSNEELETINEELRSTNEQLTATNEQLGQSATDLDRAGELQRVLLEHMREAVATLDTETKVAYWSPKAEALWGVPRIDALQRDFFSLEFGLPVNQVKATVEAVLSGRRSEGVQALDAVSRRGVRFRCTVRCAALVRPGGGGDRIGVLLLMTPPEGDT